jgi:UDP-N-acetylmuramoylalanine--D-glutamate ligase
MAKKKMIILGGGESGVGAAILAKKKGYDVFVSDGGSLKDVYKMELNEHAIAFEEGGHDEARILKAAEVVKSPGIGEKAEILKKIRHAGIQVISEVELAHRYMGESKLIAITGSNGKSTTTALIFHICQTAGLDCAMVGNIGYSFARQVALEPKQVYVAEISSFQLDDIENFHAHVAVLLNITPDHLDRYNYDMQQYVDAKFKIINKQTKHDWFVYCEDDEVTMQNINRFSIKSNPLPMSMKHEVPHGAFIRDNEMYCKLMEERHTFSINDFALKGRHNMYNSMAATAATSAIEVRKESISEALQTFESLEHRSELVSTIKGVQYVNDSKATNVNSVWFALESITQPVVLILGGVDKGNDYGIIMDLVKEKVKAIVCLGVDNKKIHDAFDGAVSRIYDTDNMKDCVRLCYQMAEKGDVVLLSPACASFDLFKSYEDRGKQFKECVKEL